jgi:hypothetical protein
MKQLKINLITLILFSVIATKSNAQQNLFSTFNNNAFSQGDTINFEVGLNNNENKIKTASIHLWIEDIATGRKWHYKYPLINGNLAARLEIDSSLFPGNYAFNFLLQKNFFRIKGEVKNPFKKDKQINYVLLSKNKDIVPGELALDINNSFISECMLFQDSAYIVFSRANHKAGNLEINLINDLDSSFIVMDSLTNFISIVDKKDTTQKTNAAPTNYSFKAQDRLFKTTMTEVVVKAKSKKIIDNFQKDNVSGLFGGADGTVIDGLESDEISRAVDIFNFLISKVAGLSIKTNDEGTSSLMWRKHRTDIFIDEIKVDADLAYQISVSDIAMIKIFEPGVQVSFGSGAGGTIAIYLKTGIYKRENKPTNNFRIMGYTGLEVIWK